MDVMAQRVPPGSTVRPVPQALTVLTDATERQAQPVPQGKMV